MLEDILKLDQQPTLTSIHIARSRIQPKNQNLSKSMAVPSARTNWNGKTGRKYARKPNKC